MSTMFEWITKSQEGKNKWWKRVLRDGFLFTGAIIADLVTMFLLTSFVLRISKQNAHITKPLKSLIL